MPKRNSPTLAAVFVAVCAVFLSWSGACATEAHHGRLMSTGQRHITLQEKDTRMERSFDVAAHATITRNGTKAKLEALKPGDTVSIVTQTDGRAIVAVSIDAYAPRSTAYSGGGQPPRPKRFLSTP